MQTRGSDQAVQAALDKLNEMSSQQTDGKWLEELVVSVGPHIRDWDVSECCRWGEWHDRERYFPDVKQMDIGIDVVAVRRDGKHIAIQCKARQDRGAVKKSEIDSFGHAAANSFWAERWLVSAPKGLHSFNDVLFGQD